MTKSTGVHQTLFQNRCYYLQGRRDRRLNHECTLRMTTEARNADRYLVTDELLKAKDQGDWRNLNRSYQVSPQVSNMELRVGAESALNVARFFKAKYEEKVRHSMGDFE